MIATLEAGRLLNLSPFDTNYDDQGRRSGFWGIGAETYPGRGIAIKWVEVDGPLVDHWPPPSVGRLFGDLPVKAIKPVPIRPPGPGLCDCARRPAIGRSKGAAGVRVARVPAPGHAGRGRALRPISVPGTRPWPGLRGRPARGLPRRDHVTEVPVSRRASRPARRLGPGVAALVLSLEYTSGRRTAKARGQRDFAPARNPPRSGRTDAGLPQSPRRSSRTSSASGST